MPDRSRDAFLHELDAVLPFPDDRRREIVEEIEAHLDDAVADGLAEDAAIGRLGDPTTLARDLARPEQSAWRILAGVGAAVRSGIGHGLYGYLLGTLFVLLGALGLAAIVQLAGAWLETGWTLQTSDGGWNTMLTALAGALGLYHAGRVIPDRLARSSRRLERNVRPWVIGITLPGVLVITVFVVAAPQNLASVVALVLAPFGLALGAYRPRLVPPGIRHYAAVAVLALLVPVALLMAAGGRVGSGGSSEVAGPLDRNLGHVGPSWSAPPPPEDQPSIESNGWSRAPSGAIAGEATVLPGALDGLRDLRLEAWHTREGFAIDTDFGQPFATAEPIRTGNELHATINTTGDPHVTSWELVLTGVGPDGVRYVVTAGNGGHSTFTGSVWNWIVAVAAD